jgi:alpha-beta hydrolase superfamily lysophospholipase
MKFDAARILKRGAAFVAVILVTVLAVRVWDKQRGPPLEPWHTHVPPELDAGELRDADWAAWLAAEDAAFADVRANVTQELEGAARNPANRYFADSPLNPARFAHDWNRSYVLEPDAPPAGVVVLLHGLTDSPFSLRHVAARYRERGWLALGIRLPAHGTVPAALARVGWRDWMAATHLAVREARRRAGPQVPFHLVGYSNGGALAVQYALDALEDPAHAMPDRIVLLSPMIGVTAFARFAGVLGWPAVIPAFAKAAWLGIEPEYNPFKYNSFPVNAARQSSLLSRALQERVQRAARDGRLAGLPPVLTFQSVVDATVSVDAIVAGLYAHLPANGSEFVVFDINRQARYGLALRAEAADALARLLPAAPRRYRTTVITNAGGADSAEVVERMTDPGGLEPRSRALGLAYPFGVFSLSHVAVPFPVSDGLYGLAPDPGEDFGIRLGALAVRGERGVLITSQEALTRLQSNPFFPYLLARIDEVIDASAAARP